MNKPSPNVVVDVVVEYLSPHSSTTDDYYVWAYHIRIANKRKETIRLLRRHWTITKASGEILQEVDGEGVIGQQPFIPAGQVFAYTSGVILEVPEGEMHGFYQMTTVDGTLFNVPIAPFILTSKPYH